MAAKRDSRHGVSDSEECETVLSISQKITLASTNCEGVVDGGGGLNMWGGPKDFGKIKKDNWYKTNQQNQMFPITMSGSEITPVSA